MFVRLVSENGGRDLGRNERKKEMVMWMRHAYFYTRADCDEVYARSTSETRDECAPLAPQTPAAAPACHRRRLRLWPGLARCERHGLAFSIVSRACATAAAVTWAYS